MISRMILGNFCCLVSQLLIFGAPGNTLSDTDHRILGFWALQKGLLFLQDTVQLCQSGCVFINCGLLFCRKILKLVDVFLHLMYLSHNGLFRLFFQLRRVSSFFANLHLQSLSQCSLSYELILQLLEKGASLLYLVGKHHDALHQLLLCGWFIVLTSHK